MFKALADATRRHLLDQLYTRDGRTLTELEEGLDMTRFGVMKHLKVLEEAGLVVTRRSGREKLHFLNAVPIQLIHERWIDKYDVLGAERLHALTDLKSALESTMTTQTDETTRPPRPSSSTASGSRPTPPPCGRPSRRPSGTPGTATRAPRRSTSRPAARPRRFPSADMVAYGAAPDQPILDGEVLEVVEGSRLVLTWRTLWDDEARAEGFTRLTYELEERGAGITQLTVTPRRHRCPAHRVARLR